MDDVDVAIRKNRFLEIWKLANKKYSKNTKRLAGEGWDHDWQLLITTMMSAQNRDEITIPVAEKLFKKYKSLKKIASASVEELTKDIRQINYNKTKAKHIVATSKILIEKYDSTVPRNVDDLISLPGVGIKTANLVLAELFSADLICVDTHVHRIANVFEIVNTKTPIQTEKELMRVVPKKYWNKLNRIFVLWGQDVRGYDANKFLDKLKEK